MLIHRDQIATFEHKAVEEYVAELTDHCRHFSPDLCATLRPEELHHAIRTGLARAESHGFTQRGPARLYVDMMILLGSGFDVDPQYPWTATILAASSRDQMDRAEDLHQRAGEFLTVVDGAGNIYTLNALAALRDRLDGGRVFERGSLVADLICLMKDIHPRKAAETGEATMRHLILEGISRGEKTYGFSNARSLMLMSVLMFAFGYSFDSDPFLPWITRTTRRFGAGQSDEMAAAMERRALIWLDAVLKNARERR